MVALCLTVILIADCGSGVLFYVDSCDMRQPRMDWNIAVELCYSAADKFKATPALISLGSLGV